MARRYWIKEIWEKCRVNICKRRQAHTSLASEKSWLDHSLRIPFGWTAPKNAKTKRARLDSCRTFACCTQVIQWKEKRRSLLDLKRTLKMIKQKGLFVFSKDYSNVQKADSMCCRTLPDSTQWRILANFYRLSEEVHFQIKRATCSHELTGFARGTPEIPDSRGDVLSHPPSYSLVLLRSKHRPSRSLHIANK